MTTNDSSAQEIDVTILMPCLNEERTLSACIQEAESAFRQGEFRFEVLIADNGSVDNSVLVARHAGARVVHVEQPGYGAALRGGIEAAKGRYIVMGDADCSYSFSEGIPMVRKLQRGAGLVIGNRFAGGLSNGAMPFLHRYFGNPVLSAIGRRFFAIQCQDFHCGLRAFSKEAILGLKLCTSGMEFASEMVVRAALTGLRIEESPVTLKRDGRDRRPHLRTWKDGWRHLRFLLLYCPRWLFFVPGGCLFLFGFVFMLLLLSGPITFSGWGRTISLDIHTLVYTGLAQIIGFQVICSGIFANLFAVSHGLLPSPKRYRTIPWEAGLIMGLLLCALGGFASLLTAIWWAGQPLAPSVSMRSVIPSSLLLGVGVQTVFFSFLFGVMGLCPSETSKKREIQS